MLRFRAVDPRTWGVLPVLCGGVLAATAACSGATGMEGEAGMEAAEGRAVAVAHVDIEHSRNVGFQSAQAIAHFVYSHDGSAAAASAPFSAVVSGARNTMPEPGRCQDLTGGALASSAPVTLLEAGTVVIRTKPQVQLEQEPADAAVRGANEIDVAAAASPPADDTAKGDTAQLDAAAGAAEVVAHSESASSAVTISLAPRAFPGVSSLASGVMYTSRDREIPLPARSEYEVHIEGSAQVPAMFLRGVAPAYLRHVTVGGTPLEQVTSLTPGSPIDLTWDIGDAADLVVVDLRNPQDGRAVLRCSYSDAAGAGTVPWVAPLADLASDSVRAELHVHRVRLVEGALPLADAGAQRAEARPGEVSNGAVSNSAVPSGYAAGTPRGQLRFDFELTRDVEFR